MAFLRPHLTPEAGTSAGALSAGPSEAGAPGPAASESPASGAGAGQAPAPSRHPRDADPFRRRFTEARGLTRHDEWAPHEPSGTLKGQSARV